MFSIIEAEHLFVEVSVWVEWLDCYISSVQSLLEWALEVLKAVRVNLPIDVPFDVVHEFVSVLLRERFINGRLIGVDFRAVLHLIQNCNLQSLTIDFRNNCGADLTLLTIQHAPGSSFVS